MKYGGFVYNGVNGFDTSISNTGALIQSQEIGVITADDGFSGVVNAGTIQGIGDIGVDMTTGGGLINIGSILGGQDGVVFNGYYASGPLANFSNNEYRGYISGSTNGIVATGLGQSVYNSGEIIGNNLVDQAANGIYLTGGGSVNNVASGSIYALTEGIRIVGGYGYVTNGGVIDAFGSQNQNGVGVLLGDGGSVTNTGTIFGGQNGVVFDSYSTLTNSGGITGAAIGAEFYQGGLAINQAGGSLIGVNAGLNARFGAVTVLNSGYIGSSGQFGVYAGAGGAIVNYAGGTITGPDYGIDGRNAAISIQNAGLIGAGGTLSQDGVFLGAGGYVDNQAPGTITGWHYGIVSPNPNADIQNAGTIYGGLTGILFQDGGNVTNSGTIIGNGAIGVVLLGSGTISNETAGLIAGHYNAIGAYMSPVTLNNAGSIVSLRRNAVYAQNGANVTNATGGMISGYFTGVFVNQAGGNVDNTGTIRADAGVYRSDGIFLRAGGTVTNHAGGFIYGRESGLAIIGDGLVTNDGSITGGNGIYLESGTVLNQTGGVIAGGYGAVVKSGTVSNAGEISGNLVGAYVDTGNITNMAGGTVTGNVQFGAEFGGLGQDGLANSGTIFGHEAGVLMKFGGTVGNAQDGQISGVYCGVCVEPGYIGTVTNSGTIREFQSGPEAYAGVALRGGGTVTNQTGAVIYGLGASGVLISNASGTIINAGSIGGYENGARLNDGGMISNAASATISGEHYGVYGGKYAAAFVTNYGLIKQSGSNGVDAVFLGGGGTLMNESSGVITAPDGNAVSISNDAASVANYGSINGHVIGIQLNTGGMVSNASTGTISAGNTAVDAEASGAYLRNDGAIVSNGVAVDFHNSGSILNNAGALITGYYSGIYLGNDASLQNNGTVNGVSNYGVVAAANASVMNADTGVILSHNFGITGTGDFFTISNAGFVAGRDIGVSLAAGMVTNMTNATIIGGALGIMTAGANATVSNAGSIESEGYDGVWLQNGTLDNSASGRISGAWEGVYVENGGVAMNEGVITATNYAGAQIGAGAILTNSGSISGPIGVLMSGDGPTLVNTGTIIGTNGDAILVKAPDPADITLGTGSTLTGDINGGGQDGQITLAGSNAMGNNIVNFGPGSGLAVATGADWMATGNWTVATVTNDGDFQPGTLGTPLYLTGNFVQASTGTLQVVVTPTVTSQLIITGAAQLGGTLTYSFAPGTYAADSYDFLTATDGVTGNFTAVDYTGSVPSALTHATNSLIDLASLVLASNLVVSPADDSIYGDAMQAAAYAAQRANSSLLDKAALGASAGGGACAAEAGVMPDALPGSASTASRMASAVANAFCKAGGWIEATGSVLNQDSTAAAAGFSADDAGFLAGIDRPMNETGTRLGLAVGYDEIWLNDRNGGKADSDTVRLGLYGSQPLGRFTLAADFLYGNASNTGTRQTGIGGVNAAYGGDAFSGGMQITTGFAVAHYAITPSAGLRIASVSAAGFVEHADLALSAFAVKAAALNYTSVQPYVTLDISRSFLTSSLVTITPDVSAGGSVELGDKGKAVALTAQDNTAFASAHARPDAGTAEFSAGIAAGKNGWSLFARYTADVSGNWTAQTGEAGMQIRF